MRVVGAEVKQQAGKMGALRNHHKAFYIRFRNVAEG